MFERIIDLSLPFRDGDAGVSIQPHATFAEKGYKTSDLALYSHAGTHLDAPEHWMEGGRTVDALDLQKCIGPATVIDLTHKPPDSQIMVDDLAMHAAQIVLGARLLLRTDWDLHADRDDYRTRFPRLSLSVAEWLAGRGVWLIGLETPSVASLTNRVELRDVHRALLSREVVIVESLANLRAITRRQVHFIALPLRLVGCDGSPVRAVAIER